MTKEPKPRKPARRGSTRTYLDGRVTLHHGDSRDVLKAIPDNSIDSVVTDPPYALVSIVKRFGKPGSAPAKDGDVYSRSSAGFMGQQWDTGETAFAAEFWAEVLRVLKPGGHIVAFPGTRTYHRMVCAIEDAGFEIRDQIGWAFGAGFPKSHNIGKALDADGRRCACQGQQEASVLLQHDLRPVRSADVPQAGNTGEERGEVLLSHMSQQGPPGAVLRSKPTQGGARREEQGLEGRGDVPQPARQLRQRQVRAMPAGFGDDGSQGRLRDGTPPRDGAMGGSTADAAGVRASQGSQPAKQLPEQSGTVAVQPNAQTGGAWPTCGRCKKPIIPDGIGSALKPAWEPICLARKPLIGTIAENVLTHGVGGINIDGCRVETNDKLGGGDQSASTKEKPDGWHRPWMENADAKAAHAGRVNANVAKAESLGRFPANLIHDGSDEVVACFPAEAGAFAPVKGTEPSAKATFNVYGDRDRVGTLHHGDSGSAARFFYSAKADAEDRLGSTHPTVKPVDLMQYLVRLVTPKGGTVLDPFAGTGTTGEAAWREGMNAILIEREAKYCEDIDLRLNLADKPTKRAAVAATKNNLDDPNSLPLFSKEGAK